MIIGGVLKEARFVKRLNRFEAVVRLDGTEHRVHVPNTGRLRELLFEDAVVMVKEFTNPARKTRYGLVLAEKDGIWVSVDSSGAPNKVVHEALLKGAFERFRGYDSIRREVTRYSSRFDFGLFSEGRECFIEVKGVTLVRGRQAIFPDAPTLRGTRHLEELTRLRQEGKDAGVIFVVQREDADYVSPNDETDRAFASALRNAREAGVELQAYTCRVDVPAGEICIARQIPVIL